MRQTLRILLAITLGIVSCGLVLVTLMVARNCWLLLGQVLMPSYALFNLMDKALVLIAGIVGLGFLVYCLEMYTSTETPIGLLHQFLRLTAPILWFLGANHAIITLVTLKMGAGTSAFLLPIGELLLGTALHYVDQRFVGKAALTEAPNFN